MRNRIYYPYAKGQATFVLTPTGDKSGVSTLRMTASANTTLTIVGDGANFYTNSGGTEGESKTWTVGTSLTTTYIKCTEEAKLIIPEQRLITQWGGTSSDVSGWVSSTNAATIISEGFPLRNLISLYINGNSSFKGTFPVGLTSLVLDGTNLTFICSGAFPVGLTRLILNGNFINYSHDGTLPLATTVLILSGNLLNLTGFDVSGTGNITAFTLRNFVTTAMTAAQLITLLSSMAGRTGNLPVTCIISDYSNSPTAATIRDATANVNGTDAEKAKYWITQIFANKATTRVTLQDTNIDKP